MPHSFSKLLRFLLTFIPLFSFRCHVLVRFDRRQKFLSVIMHTIIFFRSLHCNISNVKRNVYEFRLQKNIEPFGAIEVYSKSDS